MMARRRYKPPKDRGWFHRDWRLYVMLILPVAYYRIFCYKPMIGVIIAFQKYNMFKGMWDSKWVGLENFRFTMGIVNATLLKMGVIDKSIPFLTDGPHWQATYTLVGVWQSMGWGTILYLSAITGINPELFEAAYIDGANKLQQIWHVTLPGIRATIVVLLILNVGQMMNKRHPGSAVHR